MDVRPKSLLRALKNLGKEKNPQIRNILLKKGLNRLMKWFILASKNILDNKIELPKATKKFMEKNKHILEQIVDDNVSLDTKRELILTPGGMGFLGGGLIKTLIKWDGKKMIRSLKSPKHSPRGKQTNTIIAKKKPRNVKNPKNPKHPIAKKVPRKTNPKNQKKTIFNSQRKDNLKLIIKKNREKQKFPVLTSLLQKPPKKTTATTSDLTDLLSDFILDNQNVNSSNMSSPLTILSPNSLSNIFTNIEKTDAYNDNTKSSTPIKWTPIQLPLKPNFRLIEESNSIERKQLSPNVSPINNMRSYIEDTPYSTLNTPDIYISSDSETGTFPYRATKVSPRALFASPDNNIDSYIQQDSIVSPIIDNEVASTSQYTPRSHSPMIARFSPLNTLSDNYVSNKPTSFKTNKNKTKMEIVKNKKHNEKNLRLKKHVHF